MLSCSLSCFILDDKCLNKVQMPLTLPKTHHKDRELLLDTALQLFRRVGVERVDSCGLQMHSVISDQLLLALHSIFPENLLVQALQVVESGKVTRYFCLGENVDPGRNEAELPPPSGTSYRDGKRQLFFVEGSSGNKYLCCGPPKLHCSCPFYAYTVLAKREVLMCKHLLASCLATSLQQWREEFITEGEWAKLTDGQGSHLHNI